MTTDEYKSQYGDDSLSSPEYRASRSAQYSGKNNPHYGKTHSDASKDAMSTKLSGRTAHNKGKKITDPKKLKTINEAIVKREENYKLNNNHPRKGAVLSDDSKLKISQSVKAYVEGNNAAIVERAQKILQTKKDNGYDFTSPMKGKTLSPEAKAKIAAQLAINQEQRRSNAIREYKERLLPTDLLLLSTDKNVATIKCEACDNVFTITTQYLSKGKFSKLLCRVCNPSPIKSNDELELLSCVRSITNHTVLSGNRSTIFPLELDIFIPELSVAIEYCGLWWHSELAGKDKNYHINKHKQCSIKNIRLVTVFEDEWVNKKDIVMSRLKNILSATDDKIFARKTTINRLLPKVANTFCNSYHLQNRGTTKIAYGLYYNDALVSVMTFSSMSISKGHTNEQNHWELTRFVSVPNTIVVGGANKLLHQFIRDVDPDKITSFSDSRWGTGNVYNKLGFTKVSDTVPNYWYFKLPDMRRYHRFTMRKNNTDNKMLTEWENRQLQGYNRIWDCGNGKWEWHKK